MPDGFDEVGRDGEEWVETHTVGWIDAVASNLAHER